jgi:hypothetical protein
MIKGLFGIAAISAFSGLFAVQYIHEEPVERNRSQKPRDIMKARVRDLMQFWSKDAIWKTCLFVLMFSASPTSGDVIFYYMRSVPFASAYFGTF